VNNVYVKEKTFINSTVHHEMDIAARTGFAGATTVRSRYIGHATSIGQSGAIRSAGIANVMFCGDQGCILSAGLVLSPSADEPHRVVFIQDTYRNITIKEEAVTLYDVYYDNVRKDTRLAELVSGSNCVMYELASGYRAIGCTVAVPILESNTDKFLVIVQFAAVDNNPAIFDADGGQSGMKLDSILLLNSQGTQCLSFQDCVAYVMTESLQTFNFTTPLIFLKTVMYDMEVKSKLLATRPVKNYTMDQLTKNHGIGLTGFVRDCSSTSRPAILSSFGDRISEKVVIPPALYIGGIIVLLLSLPLMVYDTVHLFSLRCMAVDMGHFCAAEPEDIVPWKSRVEVRATKTNDGQYTGLTLCGMYLSEEYDEKKSMTELGETDTIDDGNDHDPWIVSPREHWTLGRNKTIG
jgi:hypothetical protein